MSQKDLLYHSIHNSGIEIRARPPVSGRGECVSDYLYRDDYDGAGRVPSFCALRQVYRTSPESSLAALSGNVPYAYWMLENSDGEPGKCCSGLPSFASIMTVPVISTHSSEGLLPVTHQSFDWATRQK